MKLYTPNNHIVVEIDGELYIVDTGSPLSFGFKNQKIINIEGKSYTMSSNCFLDFRFSTRN